MERVDCPQCKNVKVPAGHVCVDCAFPSPQDRQDWSEHQQQELRSLRETLRDKFAMAAMPIVSRDHTCDEDGWFETISEPSLERTQEAYAWADLMLKARVLPESG